MDWNQIAEGLKQLTRTIVPARSAEPGHVPNGNRCYGRDRFIRRPAK